MEMRELKYLTMSNIVSNFEHIKRHNVLQTIQKMIHYLKQPDQLIELRNLAEDILRGSKWKQERIQDIFIIFNFVYNKARFLRDIYGIETLKSPKHIINELKQKGNFTGDCDDISMLLAGLLKVSGYKVRFVITSTIHFPTKDFNHIYVEVYDDRKNVWYPLDATLKEPLRVKPYKRIMRFEIN